MVYDCFLDDSKDQSQNEMVVSAGFLGNKEAWGRLRREWNQRLSDDGLEYFKTTEYKMLTGQFAKFKTSEYPPPQAWQQGSDVQPDPFQTFWVYVEYAGEAQEPRTQGY